MTISRHTAAAAIACLLVVLPACAGFATSQTLDDQVTMSVGEVRDFDVLGNDYRQEPVDAIVLSGDGDQPARVEVRGKTVRVQADRVGEAEYEYQTETAGQLGPAARLVVIVREGEATPTPTPTPLPPTPTPRPAPAPATPTVTPAPATPTVTPTPQAEPVRFECSVSPRESIAVRERFEMWATYTPSDADINITFDHGDGTLESGADRQSGLFLAPGVYTVRATWRSGDQRGAAVCGNITVRPDPRPDFACSVTATAPIGVRETFEMIATSSQPGLVVEFDHGDGTVAAGARQRAYYLAPGTYRVTARWTAPSGATGSASCGTVTVLESCSGTTVRRPNGFCEPLIRFVCTLSTSGPIEPGDGWTARVTYSPADAPIRIAIHHGDGYVDSGPVSHGKYVSPGTYDVTAVWTAGNSRGETWCGRIKVQDVYTG